MSYDVVMAGDDEWTAEVGAHTPDELREMFGGEYVDAKLRAQGARLAAVDAERRRDAAAKRTA
ncbi:MAG: hypothetical protein AAGD35_08560 [Actinomycetota bacterium]